MKCMSLFSAGGGLDVGAVDTGVQLVACIENDRDAAMTLRLNRHRPDTQVVEKDIQQVDFAEWRTSEPMIVTGGPPCQPFSKNGYWVKNVNRLIESDPRNMLG